MKLCQKCGAECADDVNFCAACGTTFDGVPTENAQAASVQQTTVNTPIQASPVYTNPPPTAPPVSESIEGLTICAIVFTFVVPLVGLILSCQGRKKYPKGTKNRQLCDIFTIISGVIFGVQALVVLIELFALFISLISLA